MKFFNVRFLVEESRNKLFCVQDHLTSVSVENWTAWEENEAAQLLTFLGLDHPGKQRKKNIL